MKTNLGYYIQTINAIVKETEEVGEQMNEYYEEIRQAINEEKTATMTTERISEIQNIFKDGTKKYEVMIEKIAKLRPPARVMGIHKKFERSYRVFISGCEEMVLSLDPAKGIDIDLFDRSEEKQDEATNDITFTITKMSNLLLKK